MKVCLISSGIVQIPPDRGGAVERVIYDIAQAISNEHQVFVIDFGRRKEKIWEEGFQILRIPMSETNPFLQKIKFGFKTRRKIGQLNLDVVHLHTVFSGFPIAFLNSQDKLVYTCHNPSWVVEDLGFLNFGVNVLETYIMKKADKVTTVSDFMVNQLSRRAGVSESKLKRIYNSVEVGDIEPADEKNEKPTVLFLGKHTENKGIHIFVKACDLINEDMPIRAVSIGPFGRFGENGEKFWKESDLVEFKGAVSEERKIELLKQADVALYPTDRESLGIVFIETQAQGIPVVATDLPVCHESIDHGTTGLLVEREPEAFAEAAKRILKENWKKTRAKEFKPWLEKFSKERIAEEWREFYSELDS